MTASLKEKSHRKLPSLNIVPTKCAQTCVYEVQYSLRCNYCSVMYVHARGAAAAYGIPKELQQWHSAHPSSLVSPSFVM